MMLAALALAAQTAPAAVPVHQPLATQRVTFDRRGETSAAAAGLADIAAGRAMKIDDDARIASISKFVTMIGVLRLVEQHRLDLDSDVSRWLGWRLRDPAFPDVPITLRLLLSHRSSLTDEIDYVVPLGEPMWPRLADPKAWDVVHAPGNYFRYANVNFPVVAAVMERATGERFDRLMRRLVLAPLKIDGCYNFVTCSTTTVARIAVQYRDGKVTRDDNHGRRPACPVIVAPGAPCDLAWWRPGLNGALFSPQGGLSISARGLARIGRMLLGGGMLDGVRVLSPASVKAIAAPLWTWNGESDAASNGDTWHGQLCRYGLATIFLATTVKGCRDDPFGDGRPRYGHLGDSYGLRSGLWIDPAHGTGIAYLATDVPKTPGAISAYTATEEACAQERMP